MDADSKYQQPSLAQLWSNCTMFSSGLTPLLPLQNQLTSVERSLGALFVADNH